MSNQARHESLEPITGEAAHVGGMSKGREDDVRDGVGVDETGGIQVTRVTDEEVLRVSRVRAERNKGAHILLGR